MSEQVRNPKEIEKEAKAVYKAEDYLEAAELFTVAANGYEAQDNALAAAEMQNNACVSLIQIKEFQRAMEILGNSEKVFLDAGDNLRYAMSIGNRAAVMEGLGRNDEAIQLYTQSADLLREAGEETAYTHVMQSLSALQLKTGKSYEALASMQIAMDHMQKPGLKQRFLKRLLKFPNRFLGR